MSDLVLQFYQRLTFQWVWLWMLLPLPILLWPFLKRPARQQLSVRVPNLPALTGEQPDTGIYAPSGARMRTVIWAFMWCCLVTAVTRPEWQAPRQYQEVSLRDLVLVLDVSGSMATKDMHDSQGNALSRMVAMQQAVSRFIHDRADDNIGLVVFGSKAYPFAPLSRDHLVLQQRIGELQPAMAGPQTSIGDAIGSTLKIYDSLQKSEAGYENRERMVVLLTDGKDTSSTLPPDVALRLARKQHLIIHTIALTGGNQESINLGLLQKIARETGGTFHQVSGSAASLQDVYKAIDQLLPAKVKQLSWSWRRPLYVWPLGAAVLLMMLLALQLHRGRSHG